MQWAPQLEFQSAVLYKESSGSAENTGLKKQKQQQKSMLPFQKVTKHPIKIGEGTNNLIVCALTLKPIHKGNIWANQTSWHFFFNRRVSLLNTYPQLKGWPQPHRRCSSRWWSSSDAAQTASIETRQWRPQWRRNWPNKAHSLSPVTDHLSPPSLWPCWDRWGSWWRCRTPAASQSQTPCPGCYSERGMERKERVLEFFFYIFKNAHTHTHTP